MKSSLRLGHVAGISLGIHWSALVIVALVAGVLGSAVLPSTARGLPAGIYWGCAVVTAALLFASLLAHELAHALVAHRRGIRVKAVTLWLPLLVRCLPAAFSPPTSLRHASWTCLRHSVIRSSWSSSPTA